MRYYVSVAETLNRVVSVEADNEKEAVKKTEEAYREGKVILDGCDLADTEIEVEKDQDFYRVNEEEGVAEYERIDD